MEGEGRGRRRERDGERNTRGEREGEMDEKKFVKNREILMEGGKG